MKKYLKYIRPAIIIFFIGGVWGTILQTFLYFRSTPFGLPYVLDLSHYYFHAIFYEWYGIALISLPFFVLGLFFLHKKIVTKISFLWITQIALIAVSLFFGHLGNELQRHMGIDLSFDFAQTYGTLVNIPDNIWNAVAVDDGGSYSSLWLFSCVLFFVMSAVFLHSSKKTFSVSPFVVKIIVVAAIILFYIMPFTARTHLFGSKNRQGKLKPPVVRLFDEIKIASASKRSFENIDEKIKFVRQKWSAADGSGWSFVSDKYPMLKTRTTTCPQTDRKWNVVLIVLETFRASNMQSFNKEQKIKATPFLDSMANSSNSAYWPRFISNGQPTVYSFMSIHTSLIPHSIKTVAKAFVSTKLSSISSVLKTHGYQTSFFTGSDPDWDNQRSWLTKWYDTVYYNPDDDEKDRLVFKQAANYLKETAHNDVPFLTTIFSISNHIPFNSPEPELNITNSSNLGDKISNTMFYTDNVVKEFINSIKNEQWFEDTIVIVTGDHGFDLGERGSSSGHKNIRHETNWIPLIISSKHPMQPTGEQAVLGSHIDILPTIMELLGFCDDSSFMGHSLLTKKEHQAYAVNVKSGNMSSEMYKYSFYFPANNHSFAYKAEDLLQKNDIAKELKQDMKTYKKLPAYFCEVTDYLYEKKLVTPK